MYNYKDINKRKKFNKSELFNKIIKSIKYNRLLKKNNYFFKTKTFSKTQIINKCIFTGRSRSVYRKFKVSRMQLKQLNKTNKLIGLKKASW